MPESAVTVIPWVLSGLTIAMTWLAGRKDHRAWLLGLANQSLWFTYIVVADAWGFVPLGLALITIYIRNYRLWTRTTGHA